MKTIYADFILSLRQKKGYSQEEIAKLIGVSRPTYIAIEKGTKQLTFEEADVIASTLDVTLQELMSGGMNKEQKFKQMIFSFLRKAKNDGKGIKKTKLAKLLYFADFASYRLLEKSMSGLRYRKIEFGPVPDEYFRILQELEDDSLINMDIQPLQNSKYMCTITDTRVSENMELNLISSKEDKLIDKIWLNWKDANTDEIVKYTHLQAPYKKTEFGHTISYDLIMEEPKEKVY